MDQEDLKILNIKYTLYTKRRLKMTKESNITFRVTKEQRNQLEEIAKSDDRKISYVMQKMIKAFLEDYKEGK